MVELLEFLELSAYEHFDTEKDFNSEDAWEYVCTLAMSIDIIRQNLESKELTPNFIYRQSSYFETYENQYRKYISDLFHSDPIKAQQVCTVHIREIDRRLKHSERFFDSKK